MYHQQTVNLYIRNINITASVGCIVHYGWEVYSSATIYCLKKVRRIRTIYHRIILIQKWQYIDTTKLCIVTLLTDTHSLKL